MNLKRILNPLRKIYQRAKDLIKTGKCKKFELIIGFDEADHEQVNNLYSFLNAYIRNVLPGHGEYHGFGYFKGRRENTLIICYVCPEKDVAFTRCWLEGMAKGLKEKAKQDLVLIVETPVILTNI